MTGLPPSPLLIGSKLSAPPRRKVFFSFHYARDSWSVAPVRNSWVANPFHESQPFLDKAQWETVKRNGDAAIKRWINTQLAGTSVTVVLIGPETLGRRWVQYEVAQSLAGGKGLLGITLEGIKQSSGRQDDWREYYAYGPFKMPNNTIPIYSWIWDDGRKNMSRWIEDAARRAGR